MIIRPKNISLLPDKCQKKEIKWVSRPAKIIYLFIYSFIYLFIYLFPYLLLFLGEEEKVNPDFECSSINQLK